MDARHSAPLTAAAALVAITAVAVASAAHAAPDEGGPIPA